MNLTLECDPDFMMRVAMENGMDSIGIGALAKRAGVSIDTVRYYEKSGLLAPQARLLSGYRHYSDLHCPDYVSSVARRILDSRCRKQAR